MEDIKKTNDIESDVIIFAPKSLLDLMKIIVMFEKYGLGREIDYLKAKLEFDVRKKQIGVITNVGS